MTILEALNAIPATSELKQLKLPLKKSKALFQLRKALENTREFYVEEEKKLIDTYAAKTEDGQPDVRGESIQFGSIEDKTAFLTERDELLSSDCGIELPPIKLTESDFGNQPVSVETLEGMGGFIEIE